MLTLAWLFHNWHAMAGTDARGADAAPERQYLRRAAASNAQLGARGCSELQGDGGRSDDWRNHLHEAMLEELS